MQAAVAGQYWRYCARWHVAGQEIYPADVLPDGAGNLPVGAISPILPGDGGLHLFRILRREALK